MGIYIQRGAKHNFSRTEPIDKGVHEIKIDFRGGYRVYFVTLKGELILLLILREIKDTQRKDAKIAVEIYKMIRYNKRNNQMKKIKM
jgi:putative addiction module killer protein